MAMVNEKYIDCIDACQECAFVCNQCATGCLLENNVQELAKCIQLNFECAAICRSAAEIMSLGSTFSERICEICADICSACASECEKHEIEHCLDCADVCRECAETCITMVSTEVQ